MLKFQVFTAINTLLYSSENLIVNLTGKWPGKKFGHYTETSPENNIGNYTETSPETNIGNFMETSPENNIGNYIGNMET